MNWRTYSLTQHQDFFNLQKTIKPSKNDFAVPKVLQKAFMSSEWIDTNAAYASHFSQQNQNRIFQEICNYHGYCAIFMKLLQCKLFLIKYD